MTPVPPLDYPGEQVTGRQGQRIARTMFRAGAPLTVEEVARRCFLPRDLASARLAELERLNIAAYDPSTATWTLEEEEMRIRRSKQRENKMSDEQSEPVTEEQRAALARRMFGERYLEERAAAGDPVLSSRLRAYIAQGGPVIDLSSTPRYRHSQVLDESMTAWSDLREETPCSACGCDTRRNGWRVVDWTSDEFAPPPPFTSRRTPAGTTGAAGAAGVDLRLCAWCNDYVNAHSLDVLRTKIMRSAASVRGLGEGDRDGVKLWYEVGGGDGSPWSYVDRSLARRYAVQNYHRWEFCTNQGQANDSAVVGLPPDYIWGDDLPANPVTFLPLTKAERRRNEAEAEAYQARLEANAKDKQRMADLYAARNKDLDAASPDEYDTVLAKWDRSFDLIHRQRAR